MRRSFALVATLLAALTALAVPHQAAAIVGGTEADVGEWPWQVALVVDGTIWCGGSLLAPDVVLTAAHCTDGQQAAAFEVIAGTVVLDEGGQRRRVSAIDQHEGFDTAELVNDIALLTLDAPFELDDVVQVVEIAATDENAARTEEGDVAVVTGFGATDEDAGPSDVLLEAELDIVADRRCEALYRQEGDAVFGATQVCAGVDRGHIDACYGDSGGPLVVPIDDESTEWRLVGVVSWGAGCGQPLRPTIYTEVAAFADWLGLRGVGPDAGEHYVGSGARLPARGTRGKAGSYPLTIDVRGFDGTVEGVSVRLVGLSHQRPEDLDIWLVAPDGTVVTLLSDVGGGADLDSVSLLIVEGATPAGGNRLGAQISPTDRERDEQRKGAAPAADLADFEGIDPNGEWQLLIADDSRQASGRLDSWSLQLS